ncbi:MAG TPA: TonB-dependent receptor [Chitinophagaceae bacterium]|jgi:TonB-linked SusC/RagA family outer membrane protein|nr:TonB-dependent receptor [Chitinophagaceae bacterium]
MIKKIASLRYVVATTLFLFFSFLSFSQNNFRVTGKIRDNNGQPLDGVTVQEKGTSNRTLSKNDGSFSLSVASGNAVLVLSSIGFNQQEFPVNNTADFTASLTAASNSLEDVVVIGYATVKRKDVTGAVAGINQKDIRSRPVDNALQAMQGKVAGVDITSNERPGQVGSINIRGVRSLTASNSPLFVVDGIPLSTGGIEYLNPNDIESIDVLKDASATAIFGSRGANGVVIVTTKQGKAGKLQLSFNNAVTIENINDRAPAMTASEAIDFRRWAYYYSNPAVYPRGDNPNINNDRIIFLATSDPAAWENINKGWVNGKWDGSQVATTDWKSLVSQRGITTDNTISVSGGTNKLKAYASFGYLDNKGTSIGQKFTRYSGKASVDIQATDWFSMGLNMNITQSVQEFGQSSAIIGSFVGSPGTSIYESARRLYPYAVPYDATGARVLYPAGDVAFKNVVDEWNYSQDQRKILRAFGSLYAQLDFGAVSPILKGLKYRMNFGPDFSNFQNGIYIDALSSASSGTSSASLQKSQTFSYTIDNLLYYDKTIGKHSFGLTLLQSATKFVADPVSTITGTGIPFASQRWNTLNQSVIPAANLSVVRTADLIERQLVSYMARLNYGFTDRYLLTVSARQDGASQFAPGKKYSLFPSAAIAWRISNENFMRGTTWISDLKLRIGAGVTGNSGVDPYTTKGAITPLFYPFISAITAGSLPSSVFANQDLGWEKTTQYNLGLDFSIFNRRISGVIDVYKSKTKDLLMSRSIPTVTGFSTTLQNIGQTANRGIDININTLNLTTKSFQWTTIFNASWQKDEIVSLANGKQNDINNLWLIGQPLGIIYGIKSNGLWHLSDSVEMNKFNANLPTGKFSPGNVRPVDQNGDYKIDQNNDRVVVGSTRPRWVVGMTNGFTYKRFELSIFLYGRLNYFFNTGGEAQVARSSTRLINYYTENNTNAEYQKPIYSTGTGDLYSGSLGFQKASFIKIRNISASYNVDTKILKKMNMSSLRLYVQAANPGMLFSKIKFMDMDLASFTNNRGFTVGINAAF